MWKIVRLFLATNTIQVCLSYVILHGLRQLKNDKFLLKTTITTLLQNYVFNIKCTNFKINLLFLAF